MREGQKVRRNKNLARQKVRRNKNLATRPRNRGSVVRLRSGEPQPDIIFFIEASVH